MSNKPYVTPEDVLDFLNDPNKPKPTTDQVKAAESILDRHIRWLGVWRVGDVVRCNRTIHRYFRKGNSAIIMALPTAFPNLMEVARPGATEIGGNITVARSAFDLVDQGTVKRAFINHEEWRPGDVLECKTDGVFAKGDKVLITELGPEHGYVTVLSMDAVHWTEYVVAMGGFQLVPRGKDAADATLTQPRHHAPSGDLKAPDDFTYEVDFRRPCEVDPRFAMDLDLSLGVKGDNPSDALDELARATTWARTVILDAVQHLIVAPEESTDG